MDSSGEADENFLDSDEMHFIGGGAENQQIEFLRATLELEKGLKGHEIEDANFMISDLLNQIDDDCEEGSEDPCLEYYDEDGAT